MSVTGYAIDYGVLPQAEYDYLWEFLTVHAPYVRVEAGNMRMGKAWHGDNEGDARVDSLLEFFDRNGLRQYLAFSDLVALRYETGDDFVDWHSDGGEYMQPETQIALFSLGAERVIQFRALGETEPGASIRLRANDLLVMASDFQERYQHRVPPMECDGERRVVTLFTRREK